MGLTLTKKGSPEGSLRARQQARAKEDLLLATLAIISSEGPDGVSIERVRQDSGMSRGTLYAHCPGGRDELLLRAYEHIGTRFVEAAAELAQSREGWIDRISGYAEAMVELCSDSHIGFFYNISGPNLLGFTAGRGKGAKAALNFINRELARAIRDGEVDPATDVEGTAILLTGSLREMGMAVARDMDLAGSLLDAFERMLSGLRATV
ncbi:TetR/AcrR family transcriptional regulator [Arthrobacter sp. M4]|uniref:TetR/AcrR family transcriptional regulator n=1 Tax=Arthrobacter sp. M4 TaxID=218160 RepID=UPI001CDCA8CC|nr:TetR/AcrR family transcriptional regulator [Arthrobacter sp. M4]MCA4132550.1 TetR/AcrR family transcriptional regulator [Arthrobacter sp. M4]